MKILCYAILFFKFTTRRNASIQVAGSGVKFKAGIREKTAVFIFFKRLVLLGADRQGKKCTMKILFVCLSIAMLVACKSEHFIHYTYNGITITRVDEN